MKKFYIIFSVAAMILFFALGTPKIMDDGVHYEGFAETLAHGKIDFKNFYGFQGLSILAVPVYLITHSNQSIILTSMLLALLSIPLAYLCGRELYQSRKAGIYSLILFLLTPYPYVTLMRGFQEAALSFFVLLIIYAAVKDKKWTPLAWAYGAIIKPFALTLFPLFIRPPVRGLVSKWIWFAGALAIGGLYLGVSYYQTGHLVNNAAINSYQGNFNTGNPPPLVESFTFGIKGFGRTLANLFVASRKIMSSPLIVLIGVYELWRNRKNVFYQRLTLAAALNLLLVSLLTFAFAKYLLPAVIIFNLASIGFLLRHRWMMYLVFADALTVFLPIWNYFGKVFWNSLVVFMIPFILAAGLYLLNEFTFRNRHSYPNS